MLFRSQSGDWSVIWSSSNDKCYPQDICGLNSYCIMGDQDPDCICLPGFDSVNTSLKHSDCEKNFSTESCKNKDGITKYVLLRLDSVLWEDNSYSILPATAPKMCEEACLEDCFCEAALFKGRECRKQKLPLRFGRRKLTDSTITFVKVGTSKPIINGVPTFPTKESKKQQGLNILIIGVSLIGFAFILLAISGFLVYRNHSRRKLPQG